MDNITSTLLPSNELECSGCGAILKFKPGTHHLVCEYCSTENRIEHEEGFIVEETPLEEYFNEGIHKEDTISVVAVECNGCGATTTLKPNVTSDFCPFCDNPLVVEGGSTSTMYKPKYVLPFDIARKMARGNYSKWLKSLWYAPNDLKNYGDTDDHFNGVYIPYWTYDCHTETEYSGQRGDDYTTQQRVNVVENGRRVTRMQNVRKTRWSGAFGRVNNFFDDVLIVASKSLPPDKLKQIDAWDLDKLVPYDDKYLSGFRTETYQVKIEEGYELAKQRMNSEIRIDIRRDIGGDRQQINDMHTKYSGATFKQILIPVWLSAYRYKGKVYQFMVNGRTGAISGQRPWSISKIVLTVLFVILILIIIAFAG